MYFGIFSNLNQLSELTKMTKLSEVTVLSKLRELAKTEMSLPVSPRTVQTEREADLGIQQNPQQPRMKIFCSISAQL